MKNKDIPKGVIPFKHFYPREQILINGTNRSEVINGNDGNNKIYARNGDDTVNGGAGNDTIWGGNGKDRLEGGSGSDRVFGESGNDTFLHDVAQNQGFYDYYDGGNGTDKLVLTFTDTLLKQLAAPFASTDAYITALTNYFNNHVGGAKSFAGFGFNLAIVRIEQLEINVINTNSNPPVAVTDGYSVNEDNSLTVPTAGVLANDTDADGNALTAILVSGPAHGTLALNANGSFIYTPAANFNGLDSFSYKANDGANNGNVATATVYVAPVNDAPVANNDVGVTNEDASVVIAVLANDSDIDSSNLTPNILAAPVHGNVVVNGNGTISYTSNANYNGTDSFTYRVNDGALNSNVATVNLTVNAVNDPPLAQNESFGVEQTAQYNGTMVAVDPDGDSVTYVVTSGPFNGTLTYNNATGAFTYTPDSNLYFAGSDFFQYQAYDGAVYSNPANVSITVRGTDLPNSQQYGTQEDVILNFDSPAIYSNVNISITGGPANGILVANPDMTYTYTPNANFFGQDTINYTLFPPNNASAVNGQILILVTPVNDAPVNGVPDFPGGGTEDTPLALNGISVNDVDGNLNTVNLSVLHGILSTNLSGSPISGANLVLTGTQAEINAALATLVYQGNANFFGSDSMSMVSTDADGLQDSSTIALLIASVNDAPIANDDGPVTDEDVPIIIDVITNDLDVDSDFLTPSIVAGPLNGGVVLNPDGTITYIPNANFFGTDSFTYQVSDSLLNSNVATVHITINSDGIPAFTPQADTVDFNTITAFEGSLYNALDGDDVVQLPDAAHAAALGYDNSNGFFGEAGADNITGGANAVNFMFGGADGDTLVGGENAYNEMYGEGDADNLIGGANGASNYMYGGNGGDTLVGGNSSGNYMFGGADDDTLVGGENSYNEMHGDNDADNLTGGANGATNYMYGGNGGDTLVGGNSSGSYMYGDNGADTINGQNNASDYIEGGADGDTLIGGLIPSNSEFAQLVTENPTEYSGFNQAAFPRSINGDVTFNNINLADNNILPSITAIDRSSFGVLTGSSLSDQSQFDNSATAQLFTRVEGSIDNNPSGDVDLYQIHLYAGEILTIDVDNLAFVNPLEDSFILFYSSAGALLAQNDDAGNNFSDIGSLNWGNLLSPYIRDSLLSFTAQIDGNYYIRIENYGSNAVIGDYRLNLSIDNVNTLASSLAPDILSYANSPQGVIVDLSTNTVSGGDAQGDIISDFGNVVGSEQADTLTGDARNNRIDGFDGDDVITGGLGADILNGGGGNNVFVINVSNVDVNFAYVSDSPAGGADTIEAFNLINDTIKIIATDIPNFVHGINTTLVGNLGELDLNAGGGFQEVNINFSAPVSVFNEANFESRLQYDLTGNDSDNTITSGDLDDHIAGLAGDDVLSGGLGTNVIDGGDDFDTVSYENSTVAVAVDLTTGPGTASGVGLSDSLISIEAVRGSNQADTINVANSVSNTVEGGGGGDILTGGFPAVGVGFVVQELPVDKKVEFNQTNFPRGGILDLSDPIVLGAIEPITTFNFGANVYSNPTEFDNNFASMYARIEGKINVVQDADLYQIHLNQGDRLTADVDNNSLNINLRLNDPFLLLYDSTGHIVALNDDTPVGLPDIGNISTLSSLLSYQALSTGDYYLRIEAFFVGSGTLGTYRINLSLDTGQDTLSYAHSPAGVTINLSANIASGGDAAGDTISGFLNVSGSDLIDTLIGNIGDNHLSGLGGDDKLFGDDGADVLNGGLGVNVLDGGSGFDTVSYIDSLYGVTVNLTTETGFDTDTAGQNISDTLYNIEAVEGSNYADKIVGLTSIYENVILGRGGNDILNGAGLYNIIHGDDGADILTGGRLPVLAYINNLTGGADADRFNFDFTDQRATITDFNSSEGDVLSFAKAQFNGTDVNANNVLDLNDFTSGTANDAATHWIFNTDTSSLYYDDDANNADSVLMAVFSNNATILNTDITFI